MNQSEVCDDIFIITVIGMVYNLFPALGKHCFSVYVFYSLARLSHEPSWVGCINSCRWD